MSWQGGRDHSVECPLCELSYGGLVSDDVHCPDCGPLMFVKESAWDGLRAELSAARAEIERLRQALEGTRYHARKAGRFLEADPPGPTSAVKHCIAAIEAAEAGLFRQSNQPDPNACAALAPAASGAEES